MVKRYDTDNAADVRALLEMKHDPAIREVLPRRSKYGSKRAERYGLTPVEATPDVLVPADSFKEVIEHCHAQKIFPMYHQRATWAPAGFVSDQDGIPYCWTWSGTGWVLTIRAMEDKPTVMLSPVSGGKFVNWSSAGNYLEDFINKARNDGLCPLPEGVSFNSTNRSSSYWSQYDGLRKLYRLGAVWDCNNSAGDAVMLQHSLSCLAYGRPVFIAYNWWGHALFCVGMRWDESAYLKVVPIIQNSHGESDWIEIEGSKSIFDEAYGGISTVPTE